MKTAEISFGHAGKSILENTFIGVLGHTAVWIGGASAALVVGSGGTMVGIAALGSAALYIPAVMLRCSLDYLKISNQFTKTMIDLAYIAGSIAVGASILSVAINSAIFCAFVGLTLYACLVAIYNTTTVAAKNLIVDSSQKSHHKHHLFQRRGLQQDADVVDEAISPEFY